MDLDAEILREHSRRQAERIATWVGTDRKRLSRLMNLLLEGEYLVAQRSAWAVGICADRHPDLVHPYIGKMVSRMQDPGVHDAVKRNVVRILQTADIPKNLLGVAATVCFDYLSDISVPIAVRACSMTVLGRIAQQEPGIARELRMVIEEHLPYGTAAFQARARHVLRELGGRDDESRGQRGIRRRNRSDLLV